MVILTVTAITFWNETKLFRFQKRKEKESSGVKGADQMDKYVCV